MLRNLRALYQVMHDIALPREELAKLIAARLRTVLVSAYQHVPYYRELMQSVGYDPVHDYRGPADLAKLPITTKQTIKQKDITAFVREGSDLARYSYDATSGSTGIPLRIYRTPDERATQIARWLRVLFVNGYSIRDKVMAPVGPHRATEQDSMLQRFGLLRRRTLDYVQYSIADMVDQFLTYKPDVLYANRAHLDLMALELRRRGLQAQGLKILIGTAEIIHEHNRQLYREQFGAEVIDTYGAWEMGNMAYETPERDGLHLNEDLTYFEFLDTDGKPVGPGEPGRIVVTDLMGQLMPFIRYDQGDFIVFTYGTDRHGNPARRIQQIIGRDNEYAVLADGTKYPVHTFNRTIGQYEDLIQFRIVQKTPCQFEVLIVADTSYLRKIRDELKQQLQQQFPATVNFEIIQVDHIAADPTGKIRTFISEVK